VKKKGASGLFLAAGLLILAACSQQPPAGTATTQATLAGVVGGTDSNPTLAGKPLDLSGATITVNGDPVAAAQAVASVTVRPGMVIYAQGIDNGGSVKVDSADIQIEVKGPIASVDVPNATLVVLGQSIKVDALTRIYEENADGTYTTLALGDLTGGDYVEVSGTRQADGSVLATYIQRKASAGAGPVSVEVRGYACNLDTAAQTFDLGADAQCSATGPSVDYSGAQKVSGTPTEAGFVEVKGAYDSAANTITASKVEFKGQGEHANVDHGKGERAELYGPVTNLDPANQTFELAGFTVDYSQATVVGSLVEGAYAEVKGTPDPSDPTLVHATRVEVKYAHGGDGSSNGEVKGPVQNVDAQAMTLTVGGMTFWADQNTIVKQSDPDQPLNFSDIQPGAWVEVKYDSTKATDPSGNAYDGYATRIEVKGAGEGHSGSDDHGAGWLDLEGPVQSLDPANQTLQLLGYTVKVDANTYYEAHDTVLTADQFWGTVQVGDRVEVKGTDQGSYTVLASKVELKGAGY